MVTHAAVSDTPYSIPGRMPRSTVRTAAAHVPGFLEERVTFLRMIPLFAGMSDADLVAFASELHPQKIERGETIFREGDFPNSFLLIRSGWVKILRETPAGRSVVFELRGPGDAIGTLALTDQRTLCATALSATPAELLVMSGKHFLRFISTCSALQQGYWHDVNERLREARDLQTQIAFPMQGRIAQLLLRLAERMGDQKGESIRLPRVLTRQDIADIVGTTVETVIRTLSKWNKKGVFQTKVDEMIIPDVRKLLAIANAA